MIRFNMNEYCGLSINDSVEGEMLETKIERIVNNNEPIKDGAPIIYTERKEGVRASTNIKTDRFEVAIEAMDKTQKSYKARREEKPKMDVVKGGEEEVKKGEIDGEAKSIQGGEKK